MAGVPVSELRVEEPKPLTERDLGPYATDPRLLSWSAASVRVRTDEGEFLIRHQPLFGWTVYVLPSHQILSGVRNGLTKAGLATGIASCVDALQVVLGDPQIR
jgi:hypothetical protein